MKWAIALLLGFALIAVGWRWAPSVLYAFFIVNCFVLIIVVLLQSGKAADLAGAFGGAGSQTAFGPRGAANVLSRTTTWCAIMFMACALALVLRQERLGATGSSVLERTAKPAPAAPAQPIRQPTQTPPAQQPPANQPAPAGQPQPSPEAPKKP
jgi:preprotein translocase subunit SecG